MNKSQRRPTHEITMTITWRPTLAAKTPEAEMGTVRAELINILQHDELRITNTKITKLK